MTVLISDPEEEWRESVVKTFLQINESAIGVDNGKDCQLKIFQNKVECLFLDLNTEKHTAIEVLKYIRLSYPTIKVILTVKDLKKLDDLGLTPEDASKLGISKILVKPCSLDDYIKAKNEVFLSASWRNILDSETANPDEEISAEDNEFTKIEIGSLSFDNAAIFDHYIRLGPNNYRKIIARGDKVNTLQLEKYLKTDRDIYLYFKTYDRIIYINYLNDLISKNKQSSIPNKLKLQYAKDLVEKYIEESHTTGIRPQLVEEGKKICNNMLEIIQQNDDLAETFKNLEDKCPSTFSHCFLTTFFAILISKNLDWTSERTLQSIAFGSLFHDIGKLKLRPELQNKPSHLMTKDELSEYMLHPQFGVDLLEGIDGVNQATKQIVYQHHEYMDGLGFPNQLTLTKIYPLAKVVITANLFANHITKNKSTALDGLRTFILDKKQIAKHDPEIIRALINSFIKRK